MKAALCFGLKTPAHRATTRNLQAVYPFVVDSGLGSRGVYVGRQAGSDASFVFDPWELYAAGVITNPNILLAGVIGRGKSALAKSLAVRMTAFGVRVYVPGDPKGEWGAVARALGVRTHRARPRTPRPGQPARPRPTPSRAWAEEDWQREVASPPQLPARLARRDRTRPEAQPVERNALLLRRHHGTARIRQRPSLPDSGRDASWRRQPRARRSLNMRTHASSSRARATWRWSCAAWSSGTSPGSSTAPPPIRFDFDAPIQVLDTSRLAGDDTAVALLMTCASAWMESTLSVPDAAHRLVVYDEAWRMLRHLALVRRMQAQWKLSRALGVANLAVVHRITDLGAVGATGSEAVALAHGLLADCSTRIVYAQETDQVEPTANALGLTDVEADQLIHLPRGRGLWKIGRHSAIVDHVLGPAEHQIVDTDAAMRSGVTR